MRLPGDRPEPRPTSSSGCASSSRAGRSPASRRQQVPASRPEAHRQDVRLHELPHLRRLVEADLRPEPHAPRQPHHFAGGIYDLNHDNLIDWVLDAPVDDPDGVPGLPAPSRVPAICVGMPSFIENTPPGRAVDDAATRPRTIADFLPGAEVMMTTVDDAAPDRRTPRPRPCSRSGRPKATTGFWSWFTTVDHKKIGDPLRRHRAVLLRGRRHRGAAHPAAARAARTARCSPPTQYNELFTMHGTTMVFLVGMPLAVAFGNYLVPLMIGARDVAFPRLNMFGYWVFLLRRPVHLLELRPRRRARTAAGSATRRSRARRSSTGFLPGHGPDFWAVGLDHARHRVRRRRRSTSSSPSSTCARPA